MPDLSPADRGLTTTDAPADPVTWQHCLEDWWDEPLPREAGAHADLEELQGAWVSVGGPRSAEFLVVGSRFTFRFTGGDIYMGSFELDSLAQPRRMDMHIDEGPGEHQGKTTQCIYDLDVGTLHWCAAAPGQEERLAGFPRETDRRFLRMIFRREESL